MVTFYWQSFEANLVRSMEDKLKLNAAAFLIIKMISK